MIQFDRLPQDNPFALPAPGLYKGQITETEMRAPKAAAADGSKKPDYLNLKIVLTDINGTNRGSFYDIIAESTSSIAQYKLSRFLRACGIPLVGSMELKDLAKIVKGKTIVVDVNHDKPTNGNNPKAQIDVFSHEAYYTPDEFVQVYNIINGGVAADGQINEGLADVADEEIPFDAADGRAPASNPPTSEY